VAIADDDIERVRAAVSIVEVVQQYVPLRRVGRNWVGLCPFHLEKSGSFNVREETRRYKCFGCGASGDVFTFVREIEKLDFVGAVERLAERAGVQLTYTTEHQGRDRQRRKRLIAVMERAVEWYHQRLLTAADARAARDYLRERGMSGEVARQFRLGWAPDEWDALVTALGEPIETLQAVGLGFVNARGRPQDSFRARVMFPIFNESGDPVAFGGRVLPGSTDPAKYKNSSESEVYAKSRTLYGLNWAKQEAVAEDSIVVCEGYTDVIGFHRAGIHRAVATCGTALTDEHFRLLSRFARRIVLAYDADQAGSGAAERILVWGHDNGLDVQTVSLPAGRDPGDLAGSDPGLLVEAVSKAENVLSFRIRKLIQSGDTSTPESRARLAAQAMTIINAHPDVNLRRIHAGEVAAHVGLAAGPLIKLAESRQRGDSVVVDASASPTVTAEFVVLALMLQQWDQVAPWLAEELFLDPVNQSAFRALVETEGDVNVALRDAAPEVVDVLERVAVLDVEADAETEAIGLIGVAARRRLAGIRSLEPDSIRESAQIKLLLEDLGDPAMREEAARVLFEWLAEDTKESA